MSKIKKFFHFLLFYKSAYLFNYIIFLRFCNYKTSSLRKIFVTLMEKKITIQKSFNKIFKKLFLNYFFPNSSNIFLLKWFTFDQFNQICLLLKDTPIAILTYSFFFKKTNYLIEMDYVLKRKNKFLISFINVLVDKKLVTVNSLVQFQTKLFKTLVFYKLRCQRLNS